MVKTVFKLFVIGITLLTATVTTATEQANFFAKISDDNVELGKYITLQLSAPTSMPSLNTVNLSRLKTRFHTDNRNNIVTESGRQSWKLRLYPYQKGEHRIPALELNKFKTTPMMITVTDAIDPKSKSPLTIQYSTSSTTPWVREQVLMIYSLSSTQKLYDLKLSDAVHPVASIYTLDTEEIRDNRKLNRVQNQQQSTKQNKLDSTLNTENHTTFSYKTGYAIFNLKSGKHQISLPPLILKRDGTTTHHFYPPPLNLSVKALPLYLPATVPVGSITLKTSKPYQFKLTHRLSSTNLSLNGKWMLPSTLPDLSHQLNSTDSIQTYPDTQNKNQIRDSSGISTTIDYSVPLKPIAQGIHSLDPIRVLNFDPDSGTLRSTLYTIPEVVTLNIWLSVLLILLTGLTFLYLFVKLYRYIHFQICRYRYYKLALKLLRDSNNPESIRTALKLISQAEADRQNLTPLVWMHRYALSPDKDKLQDGLNRLFYHPQKGQDIPALVNTLIKTICSRRRIIFYNTE